MSQNRHSSSLRRLNKSKKLRRKSSQSSVQYEALEPRQLLAGDVGAAFNFDSQVFGANAGSPINSAGAVGPAHVVEVTDNGFKVFDKETGAELVNKSLQDFWTDTGGAGAQADVELADSPNHHDSHVLYDADERRWFMVSVTGLDISSALGTQNSVLLAVSRSSDPTQDWSTPLDFYDEDGDPATPAVPFRGGFRTNAQTPSTLGLSVDDHNLYVTVNEANPFATDTTYVFNKFSDLVVPNASATNRSELAHGVGTLQWGMDTVGDEVGAFGLAVPNNGNNIFLFEAANPQIAGGVTLAAPVPITVPAYNAPPQFVRQLFDSDLVNSNGQLTAHTVRNGDKMWAVHAIEGSNGTSALQWYEIDVVNQVVTQSEVIEHNTDNFIYPSIAVTDSGQVAISYTITGVDRFPSHAVSLGYLNNGVTVFEEPLIIGEGESGYFDGRGNLWGRYQTSFVDTDNPEDIWFFGQRTDANNDGQTRVTQISLLGASPIIEADGLDNTIIVRRSASTTTDIEVEIDGTVVGVFEEQFLHSITLDGSGGDDTFIVDTVNGELDFEGGVIFVGDGDDQIDLQTNINTNWELGVEGEGVARIGDDFPPPCDDAHDDEVTFNLNFEAGSRWFDATPFEDTTFGEALRGAVTSYFTDVIAPLFTGTFDLTIDINDDETDAFASSQAFGQGFEEVNGQNVWVGSPWSILTGEGDRNGAASDAVINYNLGLGLYGGDQQALLDNVGGGLTWFEFKKILGMESFIENATPTDNDIGNRHFATLYDVQLADINGDPLITNYDPTDNTFEVANYATNPSWANDGSGLHFQGIQDDGSSTELALNSNLQLINFDVLASALAGSSRNGSFHTPNDQDRAFLTGLGYELNPVTAANPDDGFLITYEGLDLILAGDGVDHFCISSSNVDIEIHGGAGDDTFNITGLGVGAVDLHGEAGDDTYQVAFSSAGAITITDSVNAEKDVLIGVGTDQDDYFIIDDLGIDVNGGVFAQTGVENYEFDGRAGDDVFDIRASVNNDKFIDGGEGNDTFFYNDLGAGGNLDQLEVLVDDPNLDPETRLRLNLTNTLTDTYTTDNLENLQVDGLFLVNGINGTPTVAGGLNLIGDGDDRVAVESNLDANWVIDTSGGGTLTMDVEPLTFSGLNEIRGTHGVNVFDINDTDTDLRIQTLEGEDVFNINNVGSGIVDIFGGDSNDLFTIVNSGGAVNLFGEVGDDFYDVDFSNPGGLITIRDSVNAENDTLSAFGTDGDDHFIFDGSVTGVNGVLVDHIGVENVTYDGGDGDDLFEVRSGSGGDAKTISGGLGNDVFWVNRGFNDNQLKVTVANPSAAVDQVRLDISSAITDTFFADTIENLSVDGTYLFDGVNGTPTVAGGFNLLGDGDERLVVESNLAADWVINGNGAGSVQMDVAPMTFDQLESIVATHGDNIFDIVNTGTDLQINTREGVDTFDLTNVGAGVVTIFAGDSNDIFNINNSGGGVFLHGEVGDDTYNIDFNNPGGLITIRDSVNSENDTMTAFGTNGDDHFIFDGSTTGVNGVLVDHLGVENVSYDGLDGDDLFEVRGSSGGDAKVISGGAGNDRFWVNDNGAGANGNVLEVSVANPSGALNQVQLDISSVITDTFLADTIENLDVDGLYIFDGVNGTPTVAGGFNLLGDGNERLEIDSNIAANWVISGDGAGTVTMDVEPMTFAGLELIDGSHGVDTVTVLNTGTDLEIRTRESDDLIDINNAGSGIVTVRAGDGNDLMNVIRSGANGVNLYGEVGDDTYTIDMTNPHGVITVRDSVNDESDTLNVLGTNGNDHFIFDGGVVNVNGVMVDIIGIENGGFDGLDGDDIFEVISSGNGGTGIRGGAGNDTFVVNDDGAGANGNTLRVTAADPAAFTDQVRLDITSVITDTFFADAIENLSVDGTYILDGSNSTPTVAGGFNLLGDGNERLVVESALAAGWVIDGDGSGTLTMDVDPVTFNGLERIDGSHGVDTFAVNATNTDLAINSRESNDSIVIENVGSGVLTANAGSGDDTLDVLNSGGGVNLDGDIGNDIFTYTDTGTGFGDLHGGDGQDQFEILNSGSSILNVDGDAGVDTFNIDNLPGTAIVNVFGGDGDDFLNVFNSGQGDLTLRGEVGDDTYAVRNIDPTIAFVIRDSINAENDSLVALGTDGDDTFDIGPDGATFNGGTAWDVEGIESFGYDGLGGNDTFNVDTGDGFDGNLTLRGGDGDDVFNIISSGTGTISLFGEGGNDTYNVWFRTGTDVRIEDSIGSEFDRFFGFGTAGNDTLNLGVGTAEVNGGTVVMTGIEQVDYDSFEGDDVFNIAETQTTSFFRGSEGNDAFNVAQSTGGNAEFFGGDGNDSFDIGDATGVNQFFGEAGIDRFVVTNHSPRGSSGSFLIDGGADRNELVVNGFDGVTNVARITTNRITGLSGVPIDYVASGNFDLASDEVGGITLNASSVNDAFDVDSFLAKNTLHMNAFGGSDRITVQVNALGSISADGGEGSDLYQYAVGSANNRFLFALDSGTGDSDRFVASLTDADDNVRFSGTAFRVETDNVRINENLESFVVNARGGDDVIDVDRIPVGFVRVIGSTGNDTVNVNNFTGINSMLVNLDDGDDTLNINAGSVTGTITAFGGDGDDRFNTARAAYSNAVIDGQEGSDTYEIFLLDRSNRLMVARDTGTVGTDEIIIHATALEDNLILRSGIVITPHQDILSNANTEVTTLYTEGSNDVISVFGLSGQTTNIRTEEGSDLVFVNSTFGPANTKVLNIDTGIGNDTVVAKGTQADTTTTISGGIGNDSIVLGSALAQNNGNLDTLFGAIHAIGGAGNDRLYLNDVGRTASYNYDISGTYVRNGGSASNFFAGVTFDETTETFRLDATNFRNHINLIPSTDTVFSLFGNGGFNSINLEGDASDGRRFFGENGGDGFWTFTDGTKDVFFSDFLLS